MSEQRFFTLLEENYRMFVQIYLIYIHVYNWYCWASMRIFLSLEMFEFIKASISLDITTTELC